MPLSFVLGEAGSGKSAYCMEEALRAEAMGKTVLMVVPEQYSHQGETAFLARRGYLHDGFSVTSFERLAVRLISNSGIRREPLDAAGRAMLIRKALLSKKNQLSFYRGGADKPGYLALFMDAVSELKKGQVTPEALFSAAAAANGSAFSHRLQDLAHILEGYNKLLGESNGDPADNLTLAAALVFDNPLLRGAKVFIDEFFRFTKNQLSFIESLLSVGADVTVSLCIKEGCTKNSLFAPVLDTKNKLIQLAKAVGSEVLPPVWLNTQKESPRYLSNELIALSRGMAGENVSYDTPPCNVFLTACKDRYEEALQIAATIRRLVFEENMTYRDIAVIAGDYESYADVIRTAFSVYEIPVFADTRRDFLSHPIVLYLFSLFDLLEKIDTKRVVAYMKSGFADITENDAFRLENYALSGAVRYGDWLDDARFLRKAKSVFSEESAQTEEGTYCLAVKQQLLFPVLELKEQFQKTSILKERIMALLAFFEETGLENKISLRINRLKENGKLREADEYEEVYGILWDTFQTMNRLLGEETAGIAAMRSLLVAGLSQKSIGVVPTVYDSVAFGDINRSVIKNVRALFFVGVNDGAVPPSASSGALLSDEEREYLISRGVSVAPSSAKRISDGEFSVYNALLVCREKLFVSYPLSNDLGDGLRPAMLVGKLKRIFPNLSVQCRFGEGASAPEQMVASKQSAYHYILTHIGETESESLAQGLYQALSQEEEYREQLRRAKKYGAYQNVSGALSKETVQALYGTNLYGTVSRFERFSACPFSFFLEYGLKAKERKVLKVDAPDVGSLLHDIIEDFSKELQRQGISFRAVTKKQQKEITDKLIEQRFGAMFIKNMYSTGRIEALKNRLKSLVAKSVWAICTHVARGEFEPTGFEVQFDANGALPPVTVPLPDGGALTMVGRIDRIDTLSRGGKLYLKVIDYKSGAKGYSLAEIFNGTTLQLTVYMVAALQGVRSDKGEENAFGGMFYFRLDDPVTDGEPRVDGDIDIHNNDNDDEDAAWDEAVLKSFKMSGLSADDPMVVSAMDQEAKGWSYVIPVYVKADGTVSKSQSKTAGAKELALLKKHLFQTLTSIGQEILNGNTAIYPVRGKNNTPCTYCKYAHVCGFDPNIHPCRTAQEFSSDEEIWKALDEAQQK